LREQPLVTLAVKSQARSVFYLQACSADLQSESQPHITIEVSQKKNRARFFSKSCGCRLVVGESLQVTIKVSKLVQPCKLAIADLELGNQRADLGLKKTAAGDNGDSRLSLKPSYT
jgi:hypothetical protein